MTTLSILLVKVGKNELGLPAICFSNLDTSEDGRQFA